MTKLEQLQESYQNRLCDLQYKYATELLDNISNSTYAKVLEANEDLFEPISSPNADEYLHKPDVLSKLINVLEKAVAQSEQADWQRQEINDYLEDLDLEQLYKVYTFIEKNF